MTDLAPRSRNRASGWTVERQTLFLAALAESGSAERAAVDVGMSASTAYRLRKQQRGADFATAWDTVLSIRAARLTEELLARANPPPRLLYFRGRVIGEKVAVSNRLLLAMLDRTRAKRARSSDDPATVFYAALARLDALKVNDSIAAATIV